MYKLWLLWCVCNGGDIYENKIRDSKKGSRRVKLEWRGHFPDMEVRLYEEYKQLRKKGLKMVWCAWYASALLFAICS